MSVAHVLGSGREVVLLMCSGRGLRFIMLALAVASLCLGCLIPNERGDRAEGGVCPDGEVCSELTPDGLLFLNPVTFDIDEPGSPLRHALVGGEYKLGMIAVGSNELPEIALEIEDPSILSGRDRSICWGPQSPALSLAAHSTRRRSCPTCIPHPPKHAGADCPVHRYQM